MKWIVSENYAASCRAAADIIRDLVQAKPDAKLGLATGGTPVPVYKHLAEMNQAGQVDFARVRTVNLDEYWGIAPDHVQSYRYFMDQHLFNHINIQKENTYVASGLGDEAQNVAELDRKVLEGGAPDLQLLGVGNNGHIAFNEAGEYLVACAHIEILTDSTITANARFFGSPAEVPTRAITMGIGSILAAKRILLLATGAAKREAIRGLYADAKVTPHNPATFLKLHQDVTILIDKDLARLAGVEF